MGTLLQITATEKPKADPIISETLVAPGQPPVPPKPVPDCTQWRYFVESWVLDHLTDESYSLPVITGYDTITYNFGGFVTSFEVPRFVNIPVIVITFHYQWVAHEHNGCGQFLTTHKSGIFTSSTASFTDQNLTNALLAGEAQLRQMEAWNQALMERVRHTTSSVMASSPSPGSISSGVYSSAEQGLKATQAQIEVTMRDYAEKVNVYNAELEQHALNVEKYQRQKDAVNTYNELLEVRSNFIREDKVGTAYTVKGAGNKTISLTVGQEISGANLISSGIQSIGSGFNIDPNTTYIITDVELTYSAPRVNVPWLQGTSFPGKIVITK